MIVRTAFFAMILLVAVQAGIAQSQKSFKFKPAGIEFSFPENWEIEEEEDTVTVAAPDKSFVVVLTLADGVTFDEATEALRGGTIPGVDDLEITGKVETFDLNGFQAVINEGTGKIDGRPMEVLAMFVMAGKPVFVFAAAEAGNFSKYEEQVSNLYASIRPIK